jgi:hypothetical protein
MPRPYVPALSALETNILFAEQPRMSKNMESRKVRSGGGGVPARRPGSKTLEGGMRFAFPPYTFFNFEPESFAKIM